MVDAVGSVAKIDGVALKIKEAANTVHQNKKDCHHIKSRVDILNRTLSHHVNNAELVADYAVRAALEALDGMLAEALEVITKCQEERTIICVYYTAGNMSRQLSKVEQRISSLSSDVMLTIMSYQILRKFQEGAAPHPPPQMSKQNQDEANKKDHTRTSQVPKFGHWDAADQTVGFTVYFECVRRRRTNYEPGKIMVEVARNIKEAVDTVIQNKDDCVEIVKHANKVSTLMSQLEDAKMLDEPPMRGALEKLIATFRLAHKLVIACQRKSLVTVCLSRPPGQLSRQLHKVMDQIASNIAEMMDIVLP